MKRASRPNAKFLTLPAAAIEYGLPRTRLWWWVDSGQLPRLDPDAVGRAIYIRRSDLDAFLDKRMIGGER